jgi:hypothetical protein
VPVPYRLIARKVGWTFSSLTGTYTKVDISIPITQTEVVDLDGNPLYVPGVTGVAVNYGASTVTLSGSLPAVEVWSAVQDNICLLANLTKSDPFSTNNGTAYYSSFTFIIDGTLTAGSVVGNITLNGFLSSGVTLTGNISQATPTDLTGVDIVGNLIFDTNTDITVTFTDCTVTGTISNLGTGLVRVAKEGTTPWLTAGTNVFSVAYVDITATGDLALSTYIDRNHDTDLGWESQNIARTLEVSEGDVYYIYVIAYGYQAGFFTATADDFSTFKLTLLPETYVDTNLSTTIRDSIASKFSTYLDGDGRVPLNVEEDLRAYLPTEVLNALHYYVVVDGSWLGSAVIYDGAIDGFKFIQGGIYINNSKFYLKVNDSITTPTNLGYLLPLFIDVNPDIYVSYPSYSIIEMNTSDIVLQYSPWTKITAEISAVDKTDIRRGLATEDNVTAGRTDTANVKKDTSLIPGLF